MTKVFVHGNPETSAIWGPLVDALAVHGIDDIALLSPPGFGAPLAATFGATADDYVDWLIGELEAMQHDSAAPIDIVGHDWGAGHVYRLVARRPDLVRSWAADIGGLLHPDYVWHDAAQAWMQPDVGEQMIEMMTGLAIDERVGMYVGLGLTPDMAQSLAAALDADMGRAILALYRSSPEAELRRLSDELAAADHGPGLIITAAADEYVSSDLAQPVAARLGADELVLDGAGHWWMVTHPDESASGLAKFWAQM